MKRRGFFGAVLGLGAAPAAAALAEPAKPETPGVDWQPKCGVCKKEAPVPIFIPLDRPVGPGVQCPFCLSVYDTTTLAAIIRDFNAREGR